jgi:hypothetical protein
VALNGSLRVPEGEIRRTRKQSERRYDTARMVYHPGLRPVNIFVFRDSPVNKRILSPMKRRRMTFWSG